MIDYPTFCQLRLLLDEKHLTTAQVAVELKLDPKTVVNWAGRTRYQQRLHSKRPSKLDAFKGQIVALLERHAYSAQQLLQQLKPQGYVGGYSILKEFVRRVRPAHKPAFLMLEFAPGECAQVDWGSFGSLTVGSTQRRLSFFVMVLCHIRHIGSNSCCRVVFETNRYTVPYLYASQQLTLKVYPDQLLLHHHEKLIATHLRSYDRRQDIKNPDHIQELLVQRHRARDQTGLQALPRISSDKGCRKHRRRGHPGGREPLYRSRRVGSAPRSSECGGER